MTLPCAQSTVYQQICSSPGATGRISQKKPLFWIDRLHSDAIHHFNTHSSQSETIHTFYRLTANLFSQSPELQGVNFLYANTHTRKEGGSHSGGVTCFGCTRRSTRPDRVLKLGRSACFCLSYAHTHTPRNTFIQSHLVLAFQHTTNGDKRRPRETNLPDPAPVSKLPPSHEEP